MNRKEIKRILDLYELDGPKHSLGQNFLLNENVLRKIIACSNLSSEDIVLEIGPGLGVLTSLLYKQVNDLFLVELDSKLLEYLKLQFFNSSNIKFFNKDILKFNFPKYFSNIEYKIIANIPYNISSKLLRIISNLENKPSLMTLLVQKELAERLVAQKGKMSVLAVVMQLFYKIEYCQTVCKTDFYPVPKVDSAIIKFSRILDYENLLDKYDLDIKDLIRLVKIAFSSRRKKIYNNLDNALIFSSNEIKDFLKNLNLNIDSRAQDFEIIDWIHLLKIMQNK